LGQSSQRIHHWRRRDCDEDGYFTVVGRADDVLNVAGHRIGTADVEGALVSHPAVAEAAVIGRPDEIKGENIKAFVILRVGHTASPELEAKLKDHVRHTLGAIGVPATSHSQRSYPRPEAERSYDAC